MSERTFEGAASIRQLPPRGMITLRGDLGDLAAAVIVPETGHIAGHVAWMSPDELLVICAQEEVGERVTTYRDALTGTHHLVQDVSAARATFEISGPHAGETLAKLCPVDVAAMAPGAFRRTRLAQVACAFWVREEGGFDLVCFASVADYAWGVLRNAAAHPVGHFEPRR
ncbi:MAG: sarcosine oxidase subunit gamma family protein [Pseudomonadota bacterium]